MKKAISKRGNFKAPRDPQTGRFEEPSPQNDPVILAHCVCLVQACNDLAPVFSLLSKEADHPAVAHAAGALHVFLTCFKESMVQQLSFDPVALKDAKKKRLTAAYHTRFER